VAIGTDQADGDLVDADLVGDDSADESFDAGVAGAITIRPRARLGSRRRQIIAFAIIAAALLVLVFRGLSNATEYFKTADQAVADRAQLGTKDFRIEGTVQPGVHQVGKVVNFVIENNGVSVPVIQNGEPPQLFQPGVPVVLDGHFATNGTFDSNLIMVKHSDSYVAAHPDRVTTIPEPGNPSS
jgi:cytochrome c-type biogenesis protein CcmE